MCALIDEGPGQGSPLQHWSAKMGVGHGGPTGSSLELDLHAADLIGSQERDKSGFRLWRKPFQGWWRGRGRGHDLRCGTSVETRALYGPEGFKCF